MTCTARKRAAAAVMLLTLLVSMLLAMPAQASTVEIKTLDAANAALNSGATRGIDVSKWNGSINWNQVVTDDVKFVFARASIGTEIDETFVRNATGANDVGIKVGAYHYAKWTDRASMEQEVRLFISQLNRVNITYPVALDVEATRGMNKATLTTLCIEFLDELKAAGYTPMLYSYTNFFNAYIDVNAVRNAGYDLWVANYLAEPSAGQLVWQHTSYGSVRGISGRVDINISYNNLGTSNDRIVVDSGVSRSIKETLNSRYGLALDMNTLNMGEMNSAVFKGLQTEIGKQFEIAFPITGVMDSRTMDYLNQISYVQGSTQGNITYLLQVRLFYKGHYTGQLTGAYDEGMAEAIRSFQRAQGLTVNGELGKLTLEELLYS